MPIVESRQALATDGSPLRDSQPRDPEPCDSRPCDPPRLCHQRPSHRMHIGILKLSIISAFLLVAMVGCSGTVDYDNPSASDLDQLTQAITNPEVSTADRAMAVAAIGKITLEDTEKTLAVLASQIHDRKLSRTIGQTMGQIGEPAVPFLVRFLHAEDEHVRTAALVGFSRLGPAGIRAIPDLIEVASDESDNQKLGPSASNTLQTIVKAAADVDDQFLIELFGRSSLNQDIEISFLRPEMTPHLIGILHNSDRQLRRSAAACLGMIGPDAKEAIPELLNNLEDRDKWVRQMSAFALHRIDPNRPEPVAVLIADLRDDDVIFRRVIARELGKYIPQVPAAVNALGHALWDREIADTVAQVMAKRGAAAHEAVPDLVLTLSDEDEKLVFSTLQALAAIGPAADSAVPALIDLLNSDKPRSDGFKQTLMFTIGRIGAGASDAATHLIRMTKHENPNLRRTAVRALGRIDPPYDVAVPALIEVLQDKLSSVRQAATTSLGDIGRSHPEVIPILANVLADDTEFVTESAAIALLEIGPEAHVAVPQIVKALNKATHPDVIHTLITILGDIGPDAAFAVPTLIDRFNTLNTVIVSDSIEALIKIGDAAVPALKTASESKQPRRSEFSKIALGRIETGDKERYQLPGDGRYSIGLGFPPSDLRERISNKEAQKTKE